MAPNPTDNDNMNNDNFSDELTPSDRTGVSFAAAVDNEEPAYRKKSSQELRAAKARQSLSASAKQWDLDGDGELDDAEMALRNLDKSHKGTLSKEQMYELMADNLQTQRQLFKVKKVVIGLVAFTCVLALCNLGTSFAAAFLAKDTTTANGKFVDTHTGNTLKTDSSATTFNIDKEMTDANRRRRVLACGEARRLVNPNAGNNAPTNYICSGAADNAVSMVDGAAIVNSCEAGGTVNVVKQFRTGPGPDHTICQLGNGYSATYDDINDQGTKYPTMSVAHENQSFLTIGPNAERTSYVITGLYSQGTERCDIDADCNPDPNSSLTCVSNVCTACAEGALCGVSGETCPDPSAPECTCLQREAVDGDGNFLYPAAWSCQISTGGDEIPTSGGAVAPDSDTCDLSCETGKKCVWTQMGDKVCECDPDVACSNGGTCTGFPCGVVDVIKDCYTDTVLNSQCDTETAGAVCMDLGGYLGCSIPPKAPVRA